MLQLIKIICPHIPTGGGYGHPHRGRFGYCRVVRQGQARARKLRNGAAKSTESFNDSARVSIIPRTAAKFLKGDIQS